MQKSLFRRHTFGKFLFSLAAFLILIFGAGENCKADEATSRAILDQTLQYWQQGNVQAIEGLFRNDFESTSQAVIDAAALLQDSNLSDKQFQNIILAANILARVGALTASSGGEGFYQLLNRNFLLLDAAVWNSTPLQGPEPVLDTQTPFLVISLCDRLGCYSQVVLFSRVLENTLQLSYSDSAELRQTVRSLRETRALADAALGVNESSTKILEEGAANTKNPPKDRLVLEIMLIQVARATGNEAMAARHLQNAGNLVEKCTWVSQAEQGIALFTIASFGYEYRYSRKPQSTEDFFKAQSQIWSALNSVDPGATSELGGLGFLPALRAIEYWAEETTRRYCDPNLSEAERQAMSDILKAHSIVLGKWRDPGLQNQNDGDLTKLNWELICGFPYWNLAVASEARRQGNLAIAEGMLKGAERENNVAGKPFTRVTQAYPDVLLKGTMQARVVGDIESEWGRFYLAKYKAGGDKAFLQQAFKKLEAAKAQQNVTQNVTGMLDLAPEYLEVLFLLKPPNWLPESKKVVEDVADIANFVGFRPALVTHHHYRSKLLEQQGDLPAALAASKQAVSLLEELISQYGGLTPLGLRLKELAPGIYQHSTMLHARAGSAQDAFVLVDRYQQVESLGKFEPRFGQQTALANTFSGVQKTRGNLAQLETSLVQTPNPSERPQLQSKLANAKADFYKEITKLRKSHPDFERLLAVRPINFGQLQKSVPADTAVVQYFPSEQTLYIFVLTGESLEVRQVDISRAGLEKAVAAFRRSIQTLQRENSQGEALYKTLLAPVEADIASKKVLAVVPTGILSYVPFAALRKDGKFLVESRELAVIHQSSQLERLAQPKMGVQGGSVVIGNPDLTLASAENEAKEVGQLLPQASVLLGKEATLARLLQKLNAPTSYLHLATHGINSSADQTESYLVLADSRLYGHDIVGLPLNETRLVTLSACQTALGETIPDSEITSLAQAFEFAGVPTVISTLWPVEDESTKQLMAAFYAKVKTQDNLAAALQHAQLTVLQSEKYKNPFYWAGIQLGGDWR